MYPTNFIGSNLSDTEYDLIAFTRFKPDLFKDESERQQTAWFDYRFMHPIERAYLFAHYYQIAYKATYEKYIDSDSSHVMGLSRPKDPLDNRPAGSKISKLRTPTCLIKARQIADDICVPYEFYTMNALRFLMKKRSAEMIVGRNASGKTRLNIQASGIYSDNIVLDVYEKWKAYTAARITWVKNPALCFSEGEDNHSYKMDCERFYIKQIIHRQHYEFALEQAVDKRLIRVKTAQRIHAHRKALQISRG